jgi:hypothetical protein
VHLVDIVLADSLFKEDLILASLYDKRLVDFFSLPGVLLPEILTAKAGVSHLEGTLTNSRGLLKVMSLCSRGSYF